jgi:predicted nuclease with TOPRIM domain
MKQCQSGGDDCKECARIISPLLLEENKKLQEELKSLRDRNKDAKNLVEENKKMQVENTELRDEVRRLKYGNKSLWDQNTTLGVEIEDLTMKMRAIRMMAS